MAVSGHLSLMPLSICFLNSLHLASQGPRQTLQCDFPQRCAHHRRCPSRVDLKTFSPCNGHCSFHIINKLLSGLYIYPVNLVNVNCPCRRCADNSYIGAGWVPGNALGPSQFTRMMNDLAAHVLKEKWYLKF